MDQIQLKSLEDTPGLSDLMELEWHDLGHTCITRARQQARQIDHILADFSLQNIKKLKEPGEDFGSDHACLSVELPWMSK